mgnify:FL=1|nr:MliC family protein [Rouxiella aceris]
MTDGNIASPQGKKMKHVMIVVAGIALAGCSQIAHKPAEPVQLHYQCGTTPLTVTLDKPAQRVDMLLDGVQLHLPQVQAASGTRYSDGHYTFWSKGTTAKVQRGDDVIIDDCQLR